MTETIITSLSKNKHWLAGAEAFVWKEMKIKSGFAGLPRSRDQAEESPAFGEHGG